MPVAWRKVRDFQDIKYEHFEGIAKITINRPEVRNAFRPETIFELQEAFADARDDPSIGVVLLTGEGPDAFCSGGDQRITGDGGRGRLCDRRRPRPARVLRSDDCRRQRSFWPDWTEGRQL